MVNQGRIWLLQEQFATRGALTHHSSIWAALRQQANTKQQQQIKWSSVSNAKVCMPVSDAHLAAWLKLLSLPTFLCSTAPISGASLQTNLPSFSHDKAKEKGALRNVFFSFFFFDFLALISLYTAENTSPITGCCEGLSNSCNRESNSTTPIWRKLASKAQA